MTSKWCYALAGAAAVSVCTSVVASTHEHEELPLSTLQLPAPLILPSTSIPTGGGGGGNLTVTPGQPNNLGAFNIVIVPGAGLVANAPALAAFNRAAQSWATRISDPITVTINADLAPTNFQGTLFPGGVIGSTLPVALTAGYSIIRDQMVADAAVQPASLNNQIVTTLPTAAQFSGSLPVGRTFNGNLLMTKANAKALGFTGLDAPAPGGFGVKDGNIDFNSGFSFDFDNSNGVPAGQMDFETVAAHEIGHLLGFTSTVDTIDQSATPAAIAPTTLDLFRFGRLANNPALAGEFTNNPRSLVPGADVITDDLADEFRMSTGVTGGDGRQASHWKDDGLTGSYVGMMDPTLNFGVTQSLTQADFRAMDLIGYDVQAVPEPSSVAALAGVGLAMLARRRRRAA